MLRTVNRTSIVLLTELRQVHFIPNPIHKTPIQNRHLVGALHAMPLQIGGYTAVGWVERSETQH